MSQQQIYVSKYLYRNPTPESVRCKARLLWKPIHHYHGWCPCSSLSLQRIPGFLRPIASFCSQQRSVPTLPRMPWIGHSPSTLPEYLLCTPRFWRYIPGCRSQNSILPQWQIQPFFRKECYPGKCLYGHCRSLAHWSSRTSCSRQLFHKRPSLGKDCPLVLGWYKRPLQYQTNDKTVLDKLRADPHPRVFNY